MEKTSSRRNTNPLPLRPRKSLGQHFLHSKSALAKICETAHPARDGLVLEIGPGKGALTARLLSSAGRVVAIEKDSELADYLRETFAEAIALDRFDLIKDDILDFDLARLRAHAPAYQVVANIPYYITGAILEKLLSAPHQPASMVLLVQKEVAERIARSKKESILSLSVKAYGTPRYVATVKKGAFTPPPRVDSAILAIDGISRKAFDSSAHETRFFTLIHAAFAHKRKFARSNLKGLVPEAAIASAIPEKARAEDLPLALWIDLARET